MRLQLSLSAEDLPKTSMMAGLPDPFCVVTLLGDNGKKPIILGQTEVLTQTRNPDWTKLFYIDDFELGKPADVIFSIYSSQERKTPLGSTLWEIGAILGAPGSRLAKKLKDGGVVISHVEQATAAGTLRFQLRGLQFVNKESGLGVLNQSDPFFELQRLHQRANAWDVVCRSPTINNNLNPVWGESFVEVHALCEGQLQQKFRLVVYDYDKGGEHDVMGQVLLTVNDLLGAVNETALQSLDKIDTGRAFTLISKGGKEAGKILVVLAEVTGAAVEQDQVEPPEPVEPPPELEAVVAQEEDITVEATPPDELVEPVAAEKPSEEKLAVVVSTAELQEDDLEVVKPTFVSYISGGCELRVIVAIDATASNGDPRQETSLHHFKNDGKNAYEEVMFSLCSILSRYDSDQKYPVYGFGAKVHGAINHCFPIGSSPEVDGVNGVLEVYKTCFRAGLVMSSPRDISQVILKASQDSTAQLEKGQYYSVLLLFTNGSPDDIKKSVDALKVSGDAPLSIVIVGVGGGVFDGIQQVESQHRANGGRDNLRFVQYEALKSDPVKLSQAALDHIPDQMVAFFVSKGIYPEPEKVDDIAVEPYSEEDDVEAPIKINEQGQAVVTGTVDVAERRKKFKKLMNQGMKEGQKFLRKNRKLVGRLQRRARRKIEQLVK